jgi:hypothetical protein
VGLATASDDDRDHHGARRRDLVIMDDFIYGEPIAAPGVTIRSSAGLDSLRTGGGPGR